MLNKLHKLKFTIQIQSQVSAIKSQQEESFRLKT